MNLVVYFPVKHSCLYNEISYVLLIKMSKEFFTHYFLQSIIFFSNNYIIFFFKSDYVLPFYLAGL